MLIPKKTKFEANQLVVNRSQGKQITYRLLNEIKGTNCWMGEIVASRSRYHLVGLRQYLWKPNLVLIRG